MDIKKEREAFENFFYENCLVQWEKDMHEMLFQKLESGDYEYVRLQSSWLSWQAAKSQAVPEGFVVAPVEPTYEMRSELSRHLGRYMQMHDRYCPKTLKKYFDRFIGDPPEWLSKEVGNWESDHAFATADLPVFIYKCMIQEAQK